MTDFEVFAVPQGVDEVLKQELARQFERYGLDVPTCRLVGSQKNTLIEIVATPKRAQREIRFLVPMEDIALGDFSQLIEDALEMNGYEVRPRVAKAP
jgi:hypothetical protein